MTRKRTVGMAVFEMPATIADAAVSTLTPEQRQKISAKKAKEIMDVCVDAAGKIAAIVERDDGKIPASVVRDANAREVLSG